MICSKPESQPVCPLCPNDGSLFIHDGRRRRRRSLQPFPLELASARPLARSPAAGRRRRHIYNFGGLRRKHLLAPCPLARSLRSWHNGPIRIRSLRKWSMRSRDCGGGGGRKKGKTFGALYKKPRWQSVCGKAQKDSRTLLGSAGAGGEDCPRRRARVTGRPPSITTRGGRGRAGL